MNKKYWLRGGIILVVLVTVVEIIFVMLGTPTLSIPGLFATFMILPSCPLLPSWSGNDPEYCKSAVTILTILISLVFYFIIGSYLGRIYGWIKNRKQAGMTMK